MSEIIEDDEWTEEAHNLRCKSDTLRTENTRLRRALEWYADATHYEAAADLPCRMAMDRGDIAIAALKGDAHE